MADFSFAVPTWTDGLPTFPNGTTVNATPLNGSIDDAVTAVASAGTVAFTGLLPHTQYLARATVSGVVREIRFTSPDSTTGTSGASALSPTAVKTANYTAAASDLVPVDTTSGAVTVTLPTAPADKAQVAVKLVVLGGSNAVTIARGGSDVFNKAGGSTSLTLSVVNQAAVLQYSSGPAVWYVVSTDVPLAGLDLRYPRLSASSGDTGKAIDAFTGSPLAFTTSGVNVIGPWASTTAYVKGDAPSRYGIVYQAILANTGVDPIADDGTHWKALGQSQGVGAIFTADWRNATYGNIGVATPGGVGSGSSSLVNDYDHAGVEAANRLQYVRYPARRGLGSVRMEARSGDIDGSHNRTEMTGTDGGKQWYDGDEMWFGYSYLWDGNYAQLAQSGSFMLFHQFYAQGLFAQGGGGTTLAKNITLPQASIEVVDARSLTADGTVSISGQSVTYTGISGDTLTGCTGGTGAISKGGVVSQSQWSSTLSGSHTFPTSTVTVASTSGARNAGIAQAGNSGVFTYTSKDATHFFGCAGGTGTFANGTAINGQISGGSPAFALELSSDASQMLVHVRGGNKTTSQLDASPRNNSYVLAPPTQGVWHDFLMHIKFSSGSDGLVEVWQRKGGGEFPLTPQVEATGANVTAILGYSLPCYAESGIYSDTGAATVVAYHGGMVARRSRVEAEAAMWRTVAATPGPQAQEFNTSGLNAAAIDALFPTTPPNGVVISDPTNGKYLVRQSGAWLDLAAPTGPAAGDLSGTYPNPVIGANRSGTMMKPSDYGMKYASFDPGFIGSGKALSSGLVLLTRLNTPGPAQAVTSLKLALVAAGATITGAGAWAYIWNASGTLLVSSADQTTAWTTAGNVVDTLMDAISVSMSFTTVADSWVWVGLHVPSATTYPSFGRIAAEGNGSVNVGLSTSQLRTSQILSQAAKVTAALTVPLSANAAGGSWVWAGLN